MIDKINDHIQKKMISMIKDIDIDKLHWDIRMSLIDHLVKVLVDIMDNNNSEPSAELLNLLNPETDFDVENIDLINVDTSKAENVIINSILVLLNQMILNQRVATMHVIKTMYFYDNGLLKDEETFNKKYKPIVRSLKKFNGCHPYVCRKCKKVYDLEKELDKVFNRESRFTDCDEGLMFSMMFTFTPINHWTCSECFDPTD